MLRRLTVVLLDRRPTVRYPRSTFTIDTVAIPQELHLVDITQHRKVIIIEEIDTDITLQFKLIIGR